MTGNFLAICGLTRALNTCKADGSDYGRLLGADLDLRLICSLLAAHIPTQEYEKWNTVSNRIKITLAVYESDDIWQGWMQSLTLTNARTDLSTCGFLTRKSDMKTWASRDTQKMTANGTAALSLTGLRQLPQPGQRNLPERLPPHRRTHVRLLGSVPCMTLHLHFLHPYIICIHESPGRLPYRPGDSFFYARIQFLN